MGFFELLQDLNLSANVIEKMEDLSPLKMLTTLDLSSNKIRVINGVRALTRLMNLNLSGNKISSMQPLECFIGSGSKLADVDLSGNLLHNLTELQIVPKIGSLRKITFHVDEDFSNPFCDDYTKYMGALKSLSCLPSLQIDGTHFQDLGLWKPETQDLLKDPFKDEIAFQEKRKHKQRTLTNPQLHSIAQSPNLTDEYDYEEQGGQQFRKSSIKLPFSRTAQRANERQKKGVTINHLPQEPDQESFSFDPTTPLAVTGVQLQNQRSSSQERESPIESGINSRRQSKSNSRSRNPREVSKISERGIKSRKDQSKSPNTTKPTALLQKQRDALRRDVENMKMQGDDIILNQNSTLQNSLQQSNLEGLEQRASVLLNKSRPAAENPLSRIQTGPAFLATGGKFANSEKNLQTEFVALLDEVERLRESVNDLNHQNERLQHEKKELEEQLKSSFREEEKTRSITQELDNARKMLRDTHDDIEKLRDDNQVMARQNDRLENEIRDLRHKESDYGKRVEESLKKSAELAKELETCRLEERQSKEEASGLKAQVSELRRVVKSYETTLQSSHSESLKNNEIAIIRIEDLTSRLRETESKCAELKSELAHNQEAKLASMEEKIKLEASLSNQLQALKLNHESAISALEEEHKVKIEDLKVSHAAIIREINESQIKENGKKDSTHKEEISKLKEQISNLQDDNSKEKHSLNKAVRKNQDLEGLLEEMGQVVHSVRVELKEKKKHDQIKTTEIETIKMTNQKKKQLEEDCDKLRAKVATLEEEISSLSKNLAIETNKASSLQKDLSKTLLLLEEKDNSLSTFKKENQNLRAKVEEQAQVVSSIEAKFDRIEDQRRVSQETQERVVDDLRAELQIKAQILSQKHRELEELKADLTSKDMLLTKESQKVQELQDIQEQTLELERTEFKKLEVKYLKKDTLLDEYENQLQLLKEEINQKEKNLGILRNQLSEKGKLAEEMVQKVENLYGEKSLFEGKFESKIQSLEDTVTNLTFVGGKKDAKIKQLERDFVKLEGDMSQIVAQLEAENKTLKKESDIKTDEIKLLLTEIDKQKKAARENLQALTKMFT